MSSSSRLPCLDVVRLLAMAMVALYHALTVCDIDPPKLLFFLDSVQLWVAVFFSISGFFVVQGKTMKTGPWLTKRLSRIFVPYWIAVTAVLLANYLSSYKPISVSLIISEYLGLAGWTHRAEIVGVHFWFVSLLLFCYAIGAIIRLFPRVLPIIIAATIAWLWFDPQYAGHTLAFLTGVYFGKYGKRPSLVSLFSVALCSVILAIYLHIGFACIALGAITLATTAIPFQLSDAASIKLSRASQLSYHFYLVHGPVYLVVAHLMPGAVLAVFSLGTFGSGLGAVILHKMESAMRKTVSVILHSFFPCIFPRKHDTSSFPGPVTSCKVE